MENNKVKTFLVSQNTHAEIMKYCKENSLKANDFVDKLLLKSIRSLIEQQKITT
jgi:hypothetical protein